MQPLCGYEHPEKQAGLITKNFQALLSSRLNPKTVLFLSTLSLKGSTEFHLRKVVLPIAYYKRKKKKRKKGEQARIVSRQMKVRLKFLIWKV